MEKQQQIITEKKIKNNKIKTAKSMSYFNSLPNTTRSIKEIEIVFIFILFKQAHEYSQMQGKFNKVFFLLSN